MPDTTSQSSPLRAEVQTIVAMLLLATLVVAGMIFGVTEDVKDILLVVVGIIGGVIGVPVLKGKG